MEGESLMKKAVQRIIQIAFLAAFIFMIANGKVQLWMRIFLAGILVSIIFGRIYCGWICPINTGMKAVTWIKKKLSIKGLSLPKFLRKDVVRYLILGIFIIIFIFTMRTGKKLPVLPALFALGIIITLFFPEELWHRYLCPYGTILSITSRKSLFSMNISEEECINCGICKKVCPAEAVAVEDDQHRIKKNDCLVCMDCSRSCNKRAIHYSKSAETVQTK